MTSNFGDLRRFDASWKLWTLKSGLRCVHAPLPDTDKRIHLGVLISTGSRFEPAEKTGISHLLEHMMFRGSSKHPSFSQLSEAFESLGGEWNAATGHEYTEYWYSGTRDKAPDAFDLFSDFLLRPALADLETEKRIVLRELEGELNENDVITDPDHHILEIIWPDTSMARPIIGTPESITKISRQDLDQWRRAFYTPENMVLCVVGGNRDVISELTSKYFEKIELNSIIKRDLIKPISTKFVGPKDQWIENSDNEYQIQVTFCCEGTGSKLTPHYDMLARVLGDGFSSRLVRRIREELGLVYDVSCDFHQYDGAGTFQITASVVDENLETFFTELGNILQRLRDEPVPESELQRHRTRALTDLEMAPAEPSVIAFRLSWAIMAGLDPGLDNWRQKLESVKPESLIHVARDLFNPKNVAVVVVGPREDAIEARLHKAAQNLVRE